MDWAKMSREVASLAKSYENLPKHIAKKHLLAAMRRAIKDANGVSILRKNTPPLSTRRGRRKKGEKPVSTGELRRSVTTKARWIGNNKTGVAVAGLGYRYGWPSQKAIWHEFGTTRMAAKRMMENTFNQIRGVVASKLVSRMKEALEAAAREEASGKNKGYGG
jgi:HK97 gp10 family phage protein